MHLVCSTLRYDIRVVRWERGKPRKTMRTEMPPWDQVDPNEMGGMSLAVMTYAAGVRQPVVLSFTTAGGSRGRPCAGRRHRCELG